MTILQYITPSRISGAEIYFLQLIERLRASGHRLIIVTKRDTPLRAELEERGFEVQAWHTHGKIDPQTLLKLCHLIRRERVQLINTHLTTASWLGGLAGLLTGVPSVAIVYAVGQAAFFRFNTRLIAVAEGVRQHLEAQGVPSAKISVIYTGVDLELYANPLPPAQAKERLGLPAQARTVGVLASLIPRKGHRFLLRALHQLGEAAADVHAVFPGEGEEEEALRALAAELKLSERVHFLGFRRDLPQVIAACDIVALPSLKEGLSVALMGAMALERPVIATDVAGMAEAIEDGQTGLLVPPENVEAMANALRRLLQDTALREHIACQGQKFVQEHFDQRQKLAEVEQFLTATART